MLAIPNNPKLIGTELFLQWAALNGIDVRFTGLGTTSIQ